MNKNKFFHFALIIVLSLGTVNAQHVLNVKVNEPKADIQPTMWGVFFEDINLVQTVAFMQNLLRTDPLNLPNL
jgi:hypothetical protein